MDAPEYARGFKGLRTRSINGSDFWECFETMKELIAKVRFDRKPYLVHAKVPLLNHHTSGVRMEWYRSEEDIASHEARDPFPMLRTALLDAGVPEEEIGEMESAADDGQRSLR